MDIVSEHIFLFPFAWEINTKNRNYNFNPQVQINQSMFKYLHGWRCEEFIIDSNENYNEFIYFYRPVRNVLYSKEAAIIKNYIYNYLDENTTCKIEIDAQEYLLKVKKIELKMVKTGVGILSIDLQNFAYMLEDDIKKINSFSQCVYPISLPINNQNYPAKITFIFKDKIIVTNILENNYMNNASQIASFLLQILGNSFITSEQKGRHKILIEPLIGSKMVTLCVVKNNEIYNKKSANANRLKFGDAERIYEITTFSLFSYARNSADNKIYDKMMLLLLVQKASLLSFSNQIAEISVLKKVELIVGIESLYEIYIQFINQIYFDEVTESEEGAFIYKTVSNILNIKNEIAQLDFELKEVHEYAELITRQAANRKMEVISIIGSGFVLPTFVTGFFGMNILDKEKLAHWWKYEEVMEWLNAYVALPMLLVFYFYMRKKTKNIWVYLVQVVLFVALIFCVLQILHSGTGI